MDLNKELPKLNPGWEWVISPTQSNDGFRIDLVKEGEEPDAYNKDSAYISGGVGFIPQHLATVRDFVKAARKILDEKATRERDTYSGENARARFSGRFGGRR